MMYGICDCDNCYVSAELVFRPDLKGTPVVVLSNNDGCVVARSNEAKALGIKAGTPYFQLAQLFPNQNQPHARLRDHRYRCPAIYTEEWQRKGRSLCPLELCSLATEGTLERHQARFQK